MAVPGGVERLADDGDLAVHHPAGADHVDAGRGLRERHVGVRRQRLVVVDLAVGREQAAVAVVGELVEAEVGHHRELVAHLGDHVGDREVEHAGRVDAAGAGGVLVLGDAEEHHAAEAELGRLGDRPLERVAGVLDDARHRGDRSRLGEALADEDRQDQRAGHHVGLGDHPAQRRGAPQPPGPDGRALDVRLLGHVSILPQRRCSGAASYLARALRRPDAVRSLGRVTGSPASSIARRRVGAEVGEGVDQDLHVGRRARARRPAGRAPRRSWPSAGRSRR